MFPVTCPECKTLHNQKPKKCSFCGYPFEVDGQDRAKAIAQHVLQKRVLRKGKSAIKTVRILFWIICSVSVISSLLLKSRGGESSALIVFALIILGLSFLSYIAPLISTGLALLYYSFSYMILPLLLGHPILLLNGIVVKGIVLGILLYGFIAILKEYQTEKKMNKLTL